MTTPTIDFTLWRDQRGYMLLPKAPLPPRRAGQSRFDRILNTPTNCFSDRIVGRGGPLVPYKSISKIPDLFKIFAKISRTPKGVLVFISNYGPFTHAGIAGRGDQVLTIINQAEEMTKRLNLLSAGSRLGAEIPITSLRGFLVTDRATGGIALKIVPATLRDALWLQLAQALSDGARMRKCRHCDEWFRAGAGTDRRADAEFCSDEHRKRSNSLKRSRKG